jgi:hypothetical protein
VARKDAKGGTPYLEGRMVPCGAKRMCMLMKGSLNE